MHKNGHSTHTFRTEQNIHPKQNRMHKTDIRNRMRKTDIQNRMHNTDIQNITDIQNRHSQLNA